MSWEKYSYTKAGAALLSESLSGGALTITRAVSGTGTVGTDLTEEVAVSGDAHELKILSIETVKDNGKAARKVNIWTNGAEEAYLFSLYVVLNECRNTIYCTLICNKGHLRFADAPCVYGRNACECQNFIGSESFLHLPL